MLKQVEWIRLDGGVYDSDDGRFTIRRRGPGTFVLSDATTGLQMQFDLLTDAQSRAEWVLNDFEAGPVDVRYDRRTQTLQRFYHCAQGAIRLQLVLTNPLQSYGREAFRVDFARLEMRFRAVVVHVIPASVNEKRIELSTSAIDATSIFGGSEPTMESYPLIHERVSARLDPSSPASSSDHSERSFTAQGQTKKLGSHSHDKHK